MSWRLFIDDERMPIREDEWFIARDYQEACWEVSQLGLPVYISFDHDLGQGPTGAEFIDWLIEHMLDEGLKFPANFDYYVHSQNTIGAANIRSKMDGAIKHFGREE
jgi:hypothetical protein